MSSDPDQLLKRVWLINGFLVLALAALGIIGIVWMLLLSLGQGSEASVRAPGGEAAGGSRPRAIRYGESEGIRGTRTRIVLINNGEGDEAIGVSLSGGGYAASGPRGALVNAVFIDSGKPEGRLLLDRPAFIETIRYPASGRNMTEADSLQPWISYQIAMDDTNRDGKLDRDDATGLYVSALDGTGFRRATPAGIHVTSHSMQPDRQTILVLALEVPPRNRRVPNEERRQRAFLYDVPTGHLTPWTALETPAARAARIVGR